MLVLWTATALAFSPDRPGIGDSTGATAPGKLMFEGGVALVPEPLVVGTNGLVGRIGLVDRLELRLRAPDIVSTDPIGVGSVGAGVKFATPLSEDIGFSVVPELSVAADTGAVGATVGGNLAASVERFSFWLHGTGGVVQQVGAVGVIGGGLGVGFGSGGLYGNAFHTFPGTFVGGGGWWALTPNAQLDIGCDVGLGGGPVVLLLGTSLQTR